MQTHKQSVLNWQSMVQSRSRAGFFMWWKWYDSLNFDLLNTCRNYPFQVQAITLTDQFLYSGRKMASKIHTYHAWALNTVRQALPYDLEGCSRNTASSPLVNLHVLYQHWLTNSGHKVRPLNTNLHLLLSKACNLKVKVWK